MDKALRKLRLQVVTELRSQARRFGLIPYLHKLRVAVQQVTGHAGYEAHFDEALMTFIEPGDVVWDVGANVGHYSTRFAEAVGPSGKVVAFEPVPDSFEKLGTQTSSFDNVQCLQLALGDEVATLSMNLSPNDAAPDNSLVRDRGGGSVDVEVAPGDKVRSERSLPQPTVIKIDVEGFEEKVIAGLTETLRSSACRGVFVEIHFGILDQMGAKQAPARIEQTLIDSGFATRWVDASHLVGERASH